MNQGGDNRAIWTDPLTPATVLLVLYADLFGIEPTGPDDPGPLEWSRANKRAEVQAETGIVVPEIAFDRLESAVEILLRDTFFNSVPDFMRICLVLNGESHDPHTAEPATVQDCAWGVTEALLLLPPERGEDGQLFSPDVVGYLEGVCKHEGLLALPGPLAAAGGRPLADAIASTRADFSDDPELANMIGGSQQLRTDEINTYVRQRTAELVARLGQLHLKNGDARGLAQRIRAEISA